VPVFLNCALPLLPLPLPLPDLTEIKKEVTYDLPMMGCLIVYPLLPTRVALRETRGERDNCCIVKEDLMDHPPGLAQQSRQ
jgi:hypothetical protein